MANPMTDSIIKESQLVDREDQLAKIIDTASRIKRDSPMPSALFGFYGPPGIGKSSLVKLITAKFKSEDVPIPFSLINLAINRKQVELNPTILIASIAQDLVQSSGVHNDQLKNGVDKALEDFWTSDPPQNILEESTKLSETTQFIDLPAWAEDLQFLSGQLVSLAREIDQISKKNTGNRRPVAVIFDETDLASTTLVNWIEEYIIDPLSQIKNCIIIWTSRSASSWRLPQTRRRMRSEKLRVFEPRMVKEQFSKQPENHEDVSEDISLAEKFFGKVYGVSGGHPYASRVAIKKLKESNIKWKESLQHDPNEDMPEEFLVNYEEQALKRIDEEFLDNYALKNLPPEVKWGCKLMGLVRVFDSRMLREVLIACGPLVGQNFSTKNQLFFDDLMKDIKKTQLLVWNKGGYAIDDPLRYLTLQYFSKCDEKVFNQVNETALVINKQWLSNIVDNRGQFVIECLYHQAQLRKESLVSDFEEQLVEYRKRFDRPETLHNALERLEGELMRDNELYKIAGPQVDELLQMVRAEIAKQ